MDNFNDNASPLLFRSAPEPTPADAPTATEAPAPASAEGPPDAAAPAPTEPTEPPAPPPPPPPPPPTLALPAVQSALQAWATQATFALPLRTPEGQAAVGRAHAAQCDALVQGLMAQASASAGEWRLSPLRERLLGLSDQALAALMATLAQPGLAAWPVSALDDRFAADCAAWQRCLGMACELLGSPSPRLVNEDIAWAEDGLLQALVAAVWRGDTALLLPIALPEHATVPAVMDLVRRVSQLVVRWGQEPDRPPALKAIRVQWVLTPEQTASPVWPRRLADVTHRVVAERLAQVLDRLPALREAARATGKPGADDGHDLLLERLQRLGQAIKAQIGDAVLGEGAFVLVLSDLPASPLLADFRRLWEAVGGQWGEGLPESPAPVRISVSWPEPVPVPAPPAQA